MTLMPGMFDYEVRIRAMDAARRRHRDRHADQPQRVLGFAEAVSLEAAEAGQ